jgi:hypothetical protein
MTISDLIARLEEYQQLHGEDCEVRLMTQQNWPLENSITGLASAAEIAAASGDCDEDEDAEEIESIVYLVEGSQIGYGSKLAWEAAY